MVYQKERFYTEPGSPVHTLYAPKVSPDGSVDLVESGVENTYEYIQSFEESTDLHTILARVAAGDSAALFARPGSYGDFTKLPSTYAEALQLQIDSNNLFKSLPVDVRSKFDNDSSKFFASAGTLEWFDNIKDVIPDEVRKAIYPDPVKDTQPVIDKEVKE